MTFMEILENVTGTGGSVCLLLLLLGGIPVCYNYIAKKSTGETSALSFITGFLSCNVWLLYGILRNDWYIVSVNIAGVILQCGYVTTFFVYTGKRTVPSLQLATSIVPIIGVYIIYWILHNDIHTCTTIVGVICSSIMILFFGAPLSQLRHVIRTKSTETLPFMVILFSFVSASLWFVYGCLKQDLFIQIPNILCIILTGFQLSLYLVFPKRKQVNNVIVK